jgi:hypothetical protein
MKSSIYGSNKIMTIIQNLDYPDLEQVMNANHAVFWTTLAEHASFIDEHYRDSKIAWTSSRIDSSYPYNLVMPLALEKADQDTEIAASIERAKKQNVHTEWWLSPAHISSGLGGRLETQGYQQGGGPAGMAVDLANLNENIPRPANFEIRHVENEATLNEWITTFIEGYGVPESIRPFFMEAYSGVGLGTGLDIRHYVGYVDGEPATASSLNLAEGVAGIYAVATRPEFRGRGLGALITLMPLLEARESGYRVGILQASEMG